MGADHHLSAAARKDHCESVRRLQRARAINGPREAYDHGQRNREASALMPPSILIRLILESRLLEADWLALPPDVLWPNPVFA